MTSNSGNTGRSNVAAKQRLRKKLQAKGKQGGQQVGAEEQTNCPLQPPADPDVLEIVQEAGQLFHTNKKEATRLYHLAVQRGYIPAYVLLSSHAMSAKDEALAIETLFSLLLHAEAPRQIPAGLLQTHAGELVMLLNQEKHAAETRRRKQDIDELSRTWPMFKEIEIFKEVQDVMSSIRSLMLKTQIEELMSNSSESPSQAQSCSAQQVPTAGLMDLSGQACNQSSVTASTESIGNSMASSAELDGSSDYAELLARVRKACNDPTPSSGTADRSDRCATDVLLDTHAELFARVKQSCNRPSEAAAEFNSKQDVVSAAAINMMD